MAEVLIVEDENDVRRVLTAQIENVGLSVSQAKNGDDAFPLLNTGYQHRIMVTDVILSGALQGPELAEKARGLIEGLKVIFASDLPQEAAIKCNAMTERDILFPKPIDSSTLLNQINEALKQPSTPLG